MSSLTFVQNTLTKGDPLLEPISILGSVGVSELPDGTQPRPSCTSTHDPPRCPPRTRSPTDCPDSGSFLLTVYYHLLSPHGAGPGGPTPSSYLRKFPVQSKTPHHPSRPPESPEVLTGHSCGFGESVGEGTDLLRGLCQRGTQHPKRNRSLR